MRDESYDAMFTVRRVQTAGTASPTTITVSRSETSGNDFDPLGNVPRNRSERRRMAAQARRRPWS